MWHTSACPIGLLVEGGYLFVHLINFVKQTIPFKTFLS